MRIAVLSDIHGNLPALEIALSETGNVDGYIVLGDVVNYGPWSNECVEVVEELPNCVKILGNHDSDFLRGECSCDNYLAKAFFSHCYEKFTQMRAIESYEKETKLGKYICIHTLHDRYIFPDTKISVNNNYIIGHSHRQFKITRNGHTILNSGSVGQNREFINEINFMIYESDNSFEFRSIIYDIDKVINQMEIMNYPQVCIDYYRHKQRK